MIVTLIYNEINIKDEKVSFDKINLKSQYKCTGKNRVYKININNIEYEFECPETTTHDGKTSVLWPSFKLPYRKYPIYVYIYATALYLSTDKSMREVAAEVRRKFGIEKFSHSTVSRNLKKLRKNLDILMELMPGNDEHKDSILIERKRWDTTTTNQFSKLLNMIEPVLKNEKTIPFGNLLNYEFHRKTGYFPL